MPEDIETLYAFIGFDGTGKKGFLAIQYEGKKEHVPLICTEDKLDEFKSVAQDICKITGLSYEIVRFVRDDVLETFRGYS